MVTCPHTIRARNRPNANSHPQGLVIRLGSGRGQSGSSRSELHENSSEMARVWISCTERGRIRQSTGSADASCLWRCNCDWGVHGACRATRIRNIRTRRTGGGATSADRFEPAAQHGTRTAVERPDRTAQPFRPPARPEEKTGPIPAAHRLRRSSRPGDTGLARTGRLRTTAGTTRRRSGLVGVDRRPGGAWPVRGPAAGGFRGALTAPGDWLLLIGVLAVLATVLRDPVQPVTAVVALLPGLLVTVVVSTVRHLPWPGRRQRAVHRVLVVGEAPGWTGRCSCSVPVRTTPTPWWLPYPWARRH